MTPDIDKFRAPHVATGQRKLDAGINVSVRRHVTGGMAGAAGEAVQFVLSRALWRRAELLDVSRHRLVMEDFPQSQLVDIQTENRPVAVHHGGYRRIDKKMRAKFR